MMLHLAMPANWHQERCWIAQVVLGQFLGLQYALSFDDADTVRIRHAGKTLVLSDAYFAAGIDSESTPTYWTVAADVLDAQLCTPRIPVLFGAPGFTTDAAGQGSLSLDVFGSAFFMLARYEESSISERDRHDRFPAEASLAARMDFLDRPIVDEYVEILWTAMCRIWPGLERKRRVARTLISCDVDVPFDPACASMARLGKRLLARAYRERSLTALTSSIGNYWAVQRGDQTRDPYWQALSWIMDVNEKAGNQVTFNVIPQQTDAARDHAPSLDNPSMRDLLRTIHSRGHLIGIHPGYNTYRHPELFARSVAMLRRVMDEEGIAQDELGGRQHYLRWDVNTTARLWAVNDLSYDSTLTYSNIAGFRSGTCHEYTMYDLVERCPLELIQRPLVVMENAVIDTINMGLGHGHRALAEMRRYKEICRRFDGDFTLLWHNSSFGCEADRHMYCDLIQ